MKRLYFYKCDKYVSKYTIKVINDLAILRTRFFWISKKNFRWHHSHIIRR